MARASPLASCETHDPSPAVVPPRARPRPSIRPSRYLAIGLVGVTALLLVNVAVRKHLHKDINTW